MTGVISQLEQGTRCNVKSTFLKSHLSPLNKVYLNMLLLWLMCNTDYKLDYSCFNKALELSKCLHQTPMRPFTSSLLHIWSLLLEYIFIPIDINVSSLGQCGCYGSKPLVLLCVLPSMSVAAVGMTPHSAVAF